METWHTKPEPGSALRWEQISQDMFPVSIETRELGVGDIINEKPLSTIAPSRAKSEKQRNPHYFSNLMLPKAWLASIRDYRG